MDVIIALLDNVLENFINFAILLFEYVGVIIITITGVQGFYRYVTRKKDIGLHLAEGLSLGLQFKLGSEILRTVVVRTMDEILIVAGIIVLRAVLALLLHWEIKNGEQEALAQAAQSAQAASDGADAAGGVASLLHHKV